MGRAGVKVSKTAPIIATNSSKPAITKYGKLCVYKDADIAYTPLEKVASLQGSPTKLNLNKSASIGVIIE